MTVNAPETSRHADGDRSRESRAGRGHGWRRGVSGPWPTPAVNELLRELDRDLIGLVPRSRRESAKSPLSAGRPARRERGFSAEGRVAHVFHGNPGTAQATVASDAAILHRLGYVRKAILVAVTRDDLVGQYIGHNRAEDEEVLKKGWARAVPSTKAYYLYRRRNERDYGQEAIENSAAGHGEQSRRPGRDTRRYQGPDGAFFREQSRHVVTASAHHIDSGLPGGRIGR